MPGDSDSKDRLLAPFSAAFQASRGGQAVPKFTAPRQWVGRWDGGGGGGPSITTGQGLSLCRKPQCFPGTAGVLRKGAQERSQD